MRITTKTGDKGVTSTVGGERIEKSHLYIEVAGVIDEVVTVIGFARSLQRDEAVKDRLENIQRVCFSLLPALDQDHAATFPSKALEELEQEMELLEKRRLVNDWLITGATPDAAALGLARTATRRLERELSRFDKHVYAVDATVKAFVNRLSDYFWLLESHHFPSQQK
ncbi:MAG: cob(I)yrinic acid a,c-diamide adenosyltransferase [Candidatus Woesearchaeota archaeon]|nr:MAG: cob(I)yrinic acid a,c-diamide adenosyltransferase [Candidatus Woesearchaeota archaeon]